MAEFDETLSGFYMTIKSICPQQLWDMVASYAEYNVYEAISHNPYTIYNGYVFLLCMFFLFVVLLSLSFAKGGLERTLLPLSLPLPFIIFHNMFDFIASLPKNKDMSIYYEWCKPLASMAETIGIEKVMFNNYVTAIVGVRKINGLDLILLTMQFLLLALSSILAVAYIYNNALGINIKVHFVNVAAILCGTYFFHPGVVAILHELGAHYIVLLVAGPLLPVIYITFALLLMLVNMCMNVFSPGREVWHSRNGRYHR